MLDCNVEISENTATTSYVMHKGEFKIRYWDGKKPYMRVFECYSEDDYNEYMAYYDYSRPIDFEYEREVFIAFGSSYSDSQSDQQIIDMYNECMDFLVEEYGLIHDHLLNRYFIYGIEIIKEGNKYYYFHNDKKIISSSIAKILSKWIVDWNIKDELAIIAFKERLTDRLHKYIKKFKSDSSILIDGVVTQYTLESDYSGIGKGLYIAESFAEYYGCVKTQAVEFHFDKETLDITSFEILFTNTLGEIKF